MGKCINIAKIYALRTMQRFNSASASAGAASSASATDTCASRRCRGLGEKAGTPAGGVFFSFQNTPLQRGYSAKNAREDLVIKIHQTEFDGVLVRWLASC
jgi:hypothetical protein